MKTIDAELTKQHFSTKVFKAYFLYLKNNHPEIDIAEICSEAGLPYEYVANEENWVSVIFDYRFIELCIKKTNQKLFSYKVGEQSLSEESIGKPLFYLSKYLVSSKFIYEQVGKFTELFSKLTRIEIIETRKDFIRLKLTALDKNLTTAEREAFKLNFHNIFENTIGHYAAIPSCQNMPPAHIEYDEIWNGGEFPAYDIRISYTSSKVLLFSLALIFSPIASVAIGVSGYFFLDFNIITSNLLSITAFFALTLALLAWKYSKLSINFHLVMKALNRFDQRYLTLQNLKEDLSKLSLSYSRFVPKEFLNLLNRTSITDVKLGDNIEAEMTIMFTDIREFTKLSEQLTPKENFQFLNSYLSRISPVIRNHNGFIDKYIGDGTMAIFPDSPKKAIFSAVDIVHHLAIYNEDRRQSGYQPISVVIALHTGKLILGTIGYSEQMQGTVISDTVNTAARLEAVAKRFDVSIIASEQTFKGSGLESAIEHRYLGNLPLTGRIEPVSIYQIYQADSGEKKILLDKTKLQFEEAVLLFNRKNFDSALEFFAEIIKLNPNDKVAQYYTDLIRRMIDSDSRHKKAG